MTTAPAKTRTRKLLTAAAAASALTGLSLPAASAATGTGPAAARHPGWAGPATVTGQRVTKAGKQITCTSTLDWFVDHTPSLSVQYSEVKWTSNPCGFVIQDRSICQTAAGKSYPTYSGEVIKVGLWDRANCNVWEDSIHHGAKRYLTASGWTGYVTFWNK